MQALPALERSALVARIVDERPYAEIAAQFQCSETAARKRVSRGLARLRAQLAEALTLDDLADTGAALSTKTVAQAIDLLSARGIPACRVVRDDVRLRDPFLVENGFSHLVPVPDGTAHIVAHYSRWPEAPEPRASSYFDLGQHTDEVFAAIGKQRDPKALPTSR